MTLPLPRLDISKGPHPLFVDLLAPILPGGVLCIGMALYRPAVANLAAPLHLNYTSNVALFVFIAYVCGVILTVVTVGILGITSLLLGAIFGNASMIRTSKEKSRSRVWRIAALQFLGPAFVRELQPADELEVLKQRLEKIAQGETTDALAKILTETVQFIGQADADARWEELYAAVTSLFYKQPELLTYGISVIGAVQSMGVACFILPLVAAVPQSCAFWTVGVITIFVTFTMFAFYGIQIGQQGTPGDIQLANILRELRKAIPDDSDSGPAST